MSPLGRHVAVVVLALGLALAGRASSSCSSSPAGCVAWSLNTAVQAPVAVDLCVAGDAAAAPAVLAFQDHDGNTLGTLAVSGDRLQARDTAGEVKDSLRVPGAALQEGRLHLWIHHDTTTHELRVLTRNDEGHLDVPVGNTANLWVTLQQQLHGHDAMRCSATTTTTAAAATSVSATTTTPLRNVNETCAEADQDPDDTMMTTEVMVELCVGAGLAGVAVVLSLAMLGLTLSLQR